MIAAMAKKPTKPTTSEPTEAEIAAAATSKKRARAERCWAKIQAALEGERCTLVSVTEIVGSTINTGYRVVPQD